MKLSTLIFIIAVGFAAYLFKNKVDRDATPRVYPIIPLSQVLQSPYSQIFGPEVASSAVGSTTNSALLQKAETMMQENSNRWPADSMTSARQLCAMMERAITLARAEVNHQTQSYAVGASTSLNAATNATNSPDSQQFFTSISERRWASQFAPYRNQAAQQWAMLLRSEQVPSQPVQTTLAHK